MWRMGVNVEIYTTRYLRVMAIIINIRSHYVAEICGEIFQISLIILHFNKLK